MIPILAVIPARYNSQRFPGKVLAQLGDKPMVQWVYEAAKQCPAFTEVLVATDSTQVADCVQKFGGKVVMTRSDHTTGSDRVAEVAQKYPNMLAVANVQGDQPFVTPEMLSQLVAPYIQGNFPDMTTLACPLAEADYLNPNSVKVICDQNSQALYFSRAPIPYYRNPGRATVYHHLGLYAFRSVFLENYSRLTPTPLEQCEGLEQLRVLEHGHSITVCQTQSNVLEVNTPEDLEQAQALINHQSPL
jgi:3-deoxy-manno-octulosonate cytidylyltransferase (CMP-KDO synthetase)